MALYKEIKEENGIKLTYHRIVSLNVITNVCNLIEVASYIDEEQREKEKEYQDLQKKNVSGEELSPKELEDLEKDINVYTKTKYYNIEYDKTMSVDTAYEYLKTTEDFTDAEDI